MDHNTRKLFDKVAEKMGWMEIGLDVAVENLRGCVGKSRHLGTSDAKTGSSGASGSDGDADKENLAFESKDYRIKSLNDSSEDEFDQFLKKMATPKTKSQTPSKKPVTISRKKSIVVVSSDSDGTFETFLSRVKTPNVKPRTIKKSDSEDSLKNFIVSDDDDFIDTKSIRMPKKMHSPSRALLRRPLSQCESCVFVSDSDDDDDNILIKSTWKSRHKNPQSSNKEKTTTLQGDGDHSLSVAAKPSPLSVFSSKMVNSLASKAYSSVPKRTFSAPSRLVESSSSEEEFTSLLDRLKKKNKLPGGTPSPAPRKDLKTPVATPNPVNGLKSSESKLIDEAALNFITPCKNIIVKPTVSQTEPWHGPSRTALCKTPGCFLEKLSNPGTTYGCNFKHNKEELTSRLFKLYNASVFDGKLPASMSVTWNKKMRKTAGYCITGQERGGGNRYARIELSEKVCDSADRLRDTLIHEMCHAATWLINGVRDGHGNFWKLYARKSTVVHPELPMVTRCHSYDIKYKFQYQCMCCQNTIGRHSKSLDTERFACALCTGKLVLLNPSKPRTPTPFANFVKENYGAARQELAGQSHGEVMRKLSADFALKTKLSQS